MSEALHLKYRPLSIEKLVGHETAVTRMRGMVDGNKIPNALLITGPSGVGKTTLARAIHHSINGADNHRDYQEVNAGENRTIEDVRSWIRTAQFNPTGKKRIICIDESQGLLSNSVATDALLKPLEEPAKNTLWILCSMDPTKFSMGKGLAIAKRCTQIVLQPHTQSDLLKQAKRIAKGENMKYVMDDENTMLKIVASNSQGDMRTLANVMQSLQQFYDGMKEKPRKLTKDHISEIIASTESSDDKLAVDVLHAVYSGKFADVQRSILDIQDGFQFIAKLTWLNSFMLNDFVLKGARHRKVWATSSNKDLKKRAGNLSLGMLAATNEALVELKSQAQLFATSVDELISARLYRLIKTIHTK